MKKLIFILSAALFFSCNSQKVGGSIILYNNVEFQIMENETVDENIQVASADFGEYIKSSPIQIPIFKSVSSEDLYIYIGLPVLFKFEDYETSQIVNADFKEISKEEVKGEQTYKVYQKGETYLVEYIIKKNRSTFYTLFNTDSKSVYKSQLDFESVKNRYK